MKTQTQKILDSAQGRMQDAQRFFSSGPAATQILRSFVQELAKQCLTQEQQLQTEQIMIFYEDCLRHNGQPKSERKERTLQ